MGLFWHILIHILMSLLAGLIVFLISKKVWLSFVPALISGVVIDADHLGDYFLVFKANFRLDYFLSGYQFLKSEKIYILFHGWEYVIIFIILALVFKKNSLKITLFSLALGLFFHLGTDSILNEGMKPQSYSIIYRADNNFDIANLITADHYQNHLKMKERLKFQ